MRLILGQMYGETAPSQLVSPTFYADAHIQKGQSLPIDNRHQDRGIYVVSGRVQIAKDTFESGRLLVLRPGDPISVNALEDTQLLLLGGDPLDGPRHIWWNFVSSSLEKLEHAKDEWARADWENGLFKLPPADNQEYAPLPKR